jgi:hypothetical protein
MACIDKIYKEENEGERKKFGQAAATEQKKTRKKNCQSPLLTAYGFVRHSVKKTIVSRSIKFKLLTRVLLGIFAVKYLEHIRV